MAQEATTCPQRNLDNFFEICEVLCLALISTLAVSMAASLADSLYAWMTQSTRVLDSRTQAELIAWQLIALFAIFVVALIVGALLIPHDNQRRQSHLRSLR